MQGQGHHLTAQIFSTHLYIISQLQCSPSPDCAANLSARVFQGATVLLNSCKMVSRCPLALTEKCVLLLVLRLVQHCMPLPFVGCHLIIVCRQNGGKKPWARTSLCCVMFIVSVGCDFYVNSVVECVFHVNLSMKAPSGCIWYGCFVFFPPPDIRFFKTMSISWTRRRSSRRENTNSSV